ncbi:unnamed protein product [Peniophora sp. CBMAI 1063]|nr:unnamed protein product [Peniophora sp. CBMAI 1063]
MISIQVGWNGESPSTYRQRSSVVHGWLTKIRGTLIDNERERQKGIKEIKRARKIHDLGLQPKRPLLSLFGGSSKPQPSRATGGKGEAALRPLARRHTMPGSTRHDSHAKTSGDAMKSGARPTRQSSSARPHHRPSGPSYRSGERPRAMEHRHGERPQTREPSRERPRAIEPPRRRATTGGTHSPAGRRPTAHKETIRPASSNQVVVATRTPLRQPPTPSRRPSAKR